jgi:hypothetical protein
VDVWEGVEAFTEARGFCELWGIEGTVLVDESGELVDRLGIRGVPTNVLVDEVGTITHIGASTPHELELAVRRLLGEGAGLEEPRRDDSWHWQTEPAHIEEQLTLRANRTTPA